MHYQYQIFYLNTIHQYKILYTLHGQFELVINISFTLIILKIIKFTIYVLGFVEA